MSILRVYFKIDYLRKQNGRKVKKLAAKHCRFFWEQNLFTIENKNVKCWELQASIIFVRGYRREWDVTFKK